MVKPYYLLCKRLVSMPIYIYDSITINYEEIERSQYIKTIYGI